MLFKRTLSLSLALVALGVVGLAVPACSGGGDDDDIASPTPTPANPDYCVLEWQGDGGGNSLNIYRLFLDASLWDGPTNDYSNVPSASSINVFAIVAYRVPSTATSLFQGLKVTTPITGTFNTTATGVEETNTFTFDDTTPQAMMTLNTDFTTGASQGSSGVGTFDGEWSEFDTTAANAVVGVGQITLTGTNGQTATIAGAQSAAFGICRPAASANFAPNGKRIPSWAAEFPLKR